MEPVPIAYKYSIELYELMQKAAAPETVGEIVVEVWEGALTRLVMDPRPEGLGLSNPYYTRLTAILKSADCIRQIRRGGGGEPSQWALLRPPTEDLLMEYAAQGVILGSKKVVTTSQTDQRLLDLNRQIQELDDRVKLLEGQMSILMGDRLNAGNNV